jgi:hypothetical protein
MGYLGGQQFVLDEALKSRSQNGYWLASSIGALGLERSIAIELDKLGVDLKQVQLSDSTLEPFKIEFLWAFPGEAPKKRSISFQTALLPGALVKLDFRKNHAYLQKSGMYTQNKESMREAINIILRTAKQGFFIISGKPLFTKEIAHSKNVREYFGDDIASKMREIHIDSRNRQLTSYGQQMLLAQV